MTEKAESATLLPKWILNYTKSVPSEKYQDCATRLENRGNAPPTKEYVDNLVAGVLASGVEGVWHSGVDPLGRSLFPSKVFPNCHPQANLEAFHYLIEKLHRIGRPLLSWYPLNMSAAIKKAKSVLTGKSLKVIQGQEVIVPELKLQDIILLELRGM